MYVSIKDTLLERPDVGVYDVEPMAVIANLVHVDVASGHILVTTL